MNRIVVVICLTLLIFSCDQFKNNEVKEFDRVQIEKENTLTSPELTNSTSTLPFKTPRVPDTVYFADEVIPLLDVDLRERFDRELVVNNFWHSNTMFYFKRANRWFPVMKPILEEHGIPFDFVYLAVIESGLTQAISPSNAVGFWQFLKETAQDYGLLVNQYVDERKNIEKSTNAACKYLNKAFEKFGSWSLAAAAYNRGKGGINSDLNSQNVESFFDLHLNEETSRYVFRILAVKYIMENPSDFGFEILDSELYPIIKTQKIKIEESIPDLVEWSQSLGFNYKIIKKLNPWILQKELPVYSNSSLYIEIPEDKEQLSNFEVIKK
jgi:hypothetical protein